MADNISVTEGSGKVLGFDDMGSVMHQRVRPSKCVSNEDLITIAFGAITASFASMGLSNITTATSLWVWDDTNAIMRINFDGGANTEIIIPRRCARTIPVPYGATQAYIKYDTAPTVGNVYCEVRK
jgi:hypothetical protein